VLEVASVESVGGSLRRFLSGMDAKLAHFYLCRKDKHLSNAAKAFLVLLQTQRTN